MGTNRCKSRGRRPWYAEGLQFRCLPDCAACCTTHGSYAYVYLEGDDLRFLSEHLGITEEEFQNRYTCVDDEDLVLKIDEPDCPFLDGGWCTVYEARPTQCRTFPFWRENLRSRVAWVRLKRFCPGVDEGELHSLATIRQHLAERTD